MLEIFSYVNNLYCLLIIFRREDFHMSTTFGVSLENKTRLVGKKKIGRENLGLRNSAFLVAQLSYPCLVLKIFLYKLISTELRKIDGVPAFILLALIMCVKCDYLFICACITTNGAGLFCALFLFKCGSPAWSRSNIVRDMIFIESKYQIDCTKYSLFLG